MTLNEALLISILKWQRIVARVQEDHGMHDCQLCIEYRESRRDRGLCSDCPIREKTRQSECLGTPYRQYRAAVRRARIDHDANYKGSVPFHEAQHQTMEMHIAAKAELDFLWSLAPPDIRAAASRLSAAL